ncbi:MAG TPA: hypothetical protein VM118_06950 [Acidobacteriota bacterium]|nr:hypothetical protein [Acidobacteriota bacterium]
MRTQNLKVGALCTSVVAVLTLSIFIAAGANAYDGGKSAGVEEQQRNWISLAANPVNNERIHYAGEVWMTFANRGSFGTAHGGSGRCEIDQEILRIRYCPSFEFPGGSRVDYLFDGGFWFGGITGADTLVSACYSQSGGTFEFNSFARIATGVPPGLTVGCGSYGENRQLEQTYWCVYSDTILTAAIAGSHTPMGLEVLQVSHQSSDNLARNFIIFDLYVTNVSDQPIQDFYAGIFTDCDAYYIYQGGTPYDDDISGFLHTWPNSTDPRFEDTLNIAWTADNDGDPENGRWAGSSARGAMGFRFLRMPKGASESFNWWTSTSGGNLDWGPRRAIDLRELGTGGQGTPQGDRNGYHFMSNGELDYGQLEAAVDHSPEGWKPPPGVLVCNLADGADTRSLFSAGPEKLLEPGETVPFTIAFIGGENIHRYPDNFENNYSCEDPYRFIADLDFSNMAKNAWWAGFIFDNFGVDTDGDGYGGEYYKPVKDFDTVYYTGDGCPDFVGPAAPPAPCGDDLTLTTRPARLEVTWSGAESELFIDPLMRMSTFEGYKIYIAARNSPDDIPASRDYSLLASWDVVDYRRFTYEPRAAIWETSSHPMTTEQWREALKDNPYADPEVPFDPLDYPAPSLGNAYLYQEIDQYGQPVQKYAYFEPQDFNQGDTIYVGDVATPNLIQRIAVVDTVIVDTLPDGTIRTGDTLQFGVYRVELDRLLSSKHYFISVTSFDFGDPREDRSPQETVPGGECGVDGIPIYSADVVEDFWGEGGVLRDSVRVIAYPNPYKSSFIGSDGKRTSYREQGFEGLYAQDIESIGDEDRRIHFINLPHTATIRIYTLDGDLIRELNHPDRILSPYSSKISWDLISRNTQAVESGIYIYRVDSKELDEPQVGKLVIIK